MGIAVSTIRYFYLNAQRLDLEYKIMLISSAKASMMSSVTELETLSSDLSDDSPIIKQLKQRQERLHLMEKKLDMQMQMYTTRLKMVERELQSCQEMMNKNIERSFSYGGR